MEAEDVAEERRRAEDPDPLDEDACIMLQGLSKRYPAEVRKHDQQSPSLGRAHRSSALGISASQSMLSVCIIRSITLGQLQSSARVLCVQGAAQAKVAVQSLSMVIERGEVFGLLGPNGAGAPWLDSVCRYGVSVADQSQAD